MTATSDTRTSGVAVLDRLGVVEDPLVGADPVSFLRSLSPRLIGRALARIKLNALPRP